MGIREWFFGEARSYNDINSGLVYSEQKVDEVKKEPEITFESDKELLEGARYVKIGDKVIGFLIKSKKSGEWEFQDIRIYLSMDIMIAITEKLKELNGCSDVIVESAKLEQRLGQLEMTNSANLTFDQRFDIAKEINEIRRRLYEISLNEYAKK